jgi:hypothetical protein
LAMSVRVLFAGGQVEEGFSSYMMELTYDLAPATWTKSSHRGRQAAFGRSV